MIKTLCNEIKKQHNSLNCEFGNELYENVKKCTNNFTTNLSFFDLKNKIDETYLDYMVQQYCFTNKNTFIIIVWPITYEPDKILFETYKKYGQILFKKEINLKGAGFKNILSYISDKRKHPWGDQLWFAEPHRHINPLKIYIFEPNQINNNENQQIDYLTKIFLNNRKHIISVKNRGGLTNLYVTTKAKRECRNKLAQNGNVKPVKDLQNRQYSHHVNDEHYETIELCRIFFNNNSIFAINYCDLTYKCDSFKIKYKRYITFINNNRWGNSNDFCINNSSILSQFGIRQSRDIDYLHNINFNIEKQIPEKEISSHNTVVKNVNNSININKIVYNPLYHFWFKNIKFCTLEFLLDFKIQQALLGNQKAKHDIFLIKEYNLKNLI